ncbi:POK6 protein, partial [Ciccaba nigrolineata]|nr:POK6 protein [Ciccaba nigrolineata]
TVRPQRLYLNIEVTTLKDLHKLLGTINRVRPYLDIATQQQKNLFDLLKGDPDLTSL